MPGIDRTRELQECVSSKSKGNPSKRKPALPQRDAFMESAIAVLASINRLNAFLFKIRKAYLSTAAPTLQQRRVEQKEGLEFWESVKSLSEAERDEIDFMVKVNFKKLLESIKTLEQANKRQFTLSLPVMLGLEHFDSDLETAEAHKLPGFMRSLGLQNPQAASMELLKAHRSAITLYLNTALAKVSKEQKDQQEIRFKRQLDRNSHSLKLDAYSAKLANEHKATKSTSSESIFTPKPFIPSDGPTIESLLSPAQIQQFESEQSVLLQQTQSELAALKQAESSLLEIYTLQSELVLHLTQQSELTDKLWEDSMYVSGRVDEGNKQLKKAKERNRDSRIWLLIFLIGASLSLLFLEAF